MSNAIEIPFASNQNSFSNSLPNQMFIQARKRNQTGNNKITMGRKISCDENPIQSPCLPAVAPFLYVPPKETDIPPIPPRIDLGEEPELDENVDNEETETNLLVKNFTQRKICHPTGEQLLLLQEGTSFYLLTKKGILKKISLSMIGDKISIRNFTSNKLKETIFLRDVKSLEMGFTTTIFSLYADLAGDESLCMSICAKEDINLIAEDHNTLKLWFSALLVVIEMFKRLQ